jgi:hypothetical protein
MSNEIAGLTRQGVYLYAAILDGCDNEKPCKWQRPDSDSIVEGTMRHLHVDSTVDIREATVRITAKNGFEFNYGIHEVAELMRDHKFFIRD